MPPPTAAAILINHCRTLTLGIGVSISFTHSAFAQQTPGNNKPNLPIPLEFMAGDHEFSFQTQINKYFSPKSDFNFLSITSAASPYKNDVREFDFINTSQVSFTLPSGIGISAGINMNARTGFSPTTGLQYIHASKTLLFVLAPGLLLTNDHNAQIVGVFEFKPKLAGAFGLYTKLQGFYNYNLNSKCLQRSYFYARIGVMYNLVAAGLGNNWDWYGGPSILQKDNYGIFFRYSFL